MTDFEIAHWIVDSILEAQARGEERPNLDLGVGRESLDPLILEILAAHLSGQVHPTRPTGTLPVALA